VIFNTRIQHFCAVVEAGSLHKAAAVLHLTAGSLSRSLKQLREDAGFELFRLDGRKLVLTPQGRDLYRHCRESIESNDQKLRQIRQARGMEHAELRLGTFELFSTHFLVDLLEDDVFDLYPTVHELIPGQIEAALAREEIDFGITTIPVTTEGIEHLPVRKIEVGIYARPGAFDQQALKDLPFATPISPLSRNALNATSIDGWDARIPRHVKYRFEMLETALLAARQGRCVVFVPRYLGDRPEFGLRSLPRIERQVRLPSMMVYLVKRASQPESGIEKRLHRAIRLGLSRSR
jgi:DNA-binding transcriptional LysR family regulator